MKYAVITGGTKGIGKALVLTFSSKGYAVITCSRSQESLDDLHLEHQKHHFNTPLFTAVSDLASEKGRTDFANFVLSKGHPISVLVNNAGIYVPGQVSSEPNGTLDFMLQANLISAYEITRALLPSIQSAENPHIFNMCSTASITPYINGGSYCIAKHALLGFNKVLREELKSKGVKVTAILPGATKTASWDGVDLPEKYFMQAQDIADVVWAAYQLSPSACVEELLIRPLPGDIPA